MTNHNVEVAHSSDFPDWETPQEFIDSLPFKFTLDVCATINNKKAEHWISPSKDSLSSDVRWIGTWFCNPPYGRSIGKWIKKGVLEAENNQSVGVILIPNRTETKWFNLLWEHAEIITFVGKRVKFGHPDETKAGNGAPFASVVAVLGPVVKTDSMLDKFSDLGTTLSLGCGNLWLYKGRG